MTGPTVRIRTHEMWTLLEHVDLVGLLRDALLGADTRQGELTALDAGRLAFHDESTGQCGELPAGDLRALCTAGLAALAARLLLTDAVITAGIVGPRRSAQWQLGVISRCVPNVSHVAVFSADRTEEPAVDPTVLHRLELDGIGLSVVTSVADAVLGATLVVALGQTGEQIGYDQLARGSLMVDAAGQRPAGDLREGVAERLSAGDLAILLGNHVSRRVDLDEIRLVELADSELLRELETALAHRLVGTATRLGIGILDKNGATS